MNNGSTPVEDRNNLRGHALKFIILLGIVSLLADMTYEGARSITGPYLAMLGANAVVVGFVSGFGEFIGYALRLVSGYLSDKTRKYWAITITGYFINLLAVPLLALAGSWEIAAVLLITERMGKAFRTPARDVMLSHACSEVGQGWGFGLHEAMDQIGAIIGPLIVAAVLFLNGSYQTSFAFLIIPAVLALSVLIVSRFLYPNPHELEIKTPKLETKGFKHVYWIYMAAVALIALGFVDFPLIAFHFKNSIIVSDSLTPVFYAIAMGVDALAALVFGRLFDKIGLSIMIVVAVLSAFFAPLVFLGGFYSALIGIALWGIGLGAQESIMRAAIAGMSPVQRRGTAYGVFNTIFGAFWFMGSLTMGILYDISIFYLVIFSMIAQLASVPLFLLIRKSI
ncbi:MULTISPECIES: MFS transporter [Methanobacterium]|jgi:MFS family permease|uniref:MFS transporter n=1 Tax=Methanobacterium veterum TaxID=408577 RepID=A0A9E5DLY9_9EURY|nr:MULTISPECIES: MFS transporter [Methanobacterium]MCZ3366681.1 MFS transporter [Methanobacterium veterum]MCZ3374174.1 MFS transporter [Methanobacterium veterum]